MQSRNFVLVLALCVGPVSRAHADVLCKSRTGSAFIRTSCHANETVVDPTSLSPALTPLSLVDNGATLRVRGVNLQVMSDSIAYTSVGGGSANYAQGDYSSVSGGTGNVTPGAFSTVTGGALNQATGQNSSVSGGFGRVCEGVDGWCAGEHLED